MKRCIATETFSPSARSFFSVTLTWKPLPGVTLVGVSTLRKSSSWMDVAPDAAPLSGFFDAPSAFFGASSAFFAQLILPQKSLCVALFQVPFGAMKTRGP